MTEEESSYDLVITRKDFVSPSARHNGDGFFRLAACHGRFGAPATLEQRHACVLSSNGYLGEGPPPGAKNQAHPYLRRTFPPPPAGGSCVGSRMRNATRPTGCVVMPRYAEVKYLITYHSEPARCLVEGKVMCVIWRILWREWIGFLNQS